MRWRIVLVVNGPCLFVGWIMGVVGTMVKLNVDEKGTDDTK